MSRPNLLAGGRVARFVLIELNERRHDHLEGVLNRRFPELPAGLELRVRQGSFQELAEPLLDETGAWGHPIFANLDPFGVDVPYAQVRRIVSNPSSEILVTFMSAFFRRFATLDELDKGDLQFGSTSWRAVAQLPPGPQKKQFLVEQYREAIRRAGPSLSLPFEMLDEGGREFFLIFGTSHPLGFERMKEAMWKVDPVYGIRFRDPRDVSQTSLLIEEPDLAPLTKRLLDALADREKHSVESLRDLTLFETVYLPKHAMTVLRRLRDEEVLAQEPKGRLTRRSRVRLL